MSLENLDLDDDPESGAALNYSKIIRMLRQLDEEVRLITLRVGELEEEATSRAEMVDAFVGALEDRVNDLTQEIERTNDEEKTVPV